MPEDLQALEHLNSLVELHVVLGHYSNNPELQLDFRKGFDVILDRHGSSLRNLTLGRIRNVDIERIARCCRQLSSLSLELNYSYQPEELGIEAVRSLGKLHLSVRDREFEEEEESNRDVPVPYLAALISSPNIRHIKITASQTIDDQTLRVNLVGQYLESLELESCSNISMQSLWYVVGRSKRLTNLKLYRCRQVTDQDINELDNAIDEHHWDLDLDYYCDNS